MSHEQRQRMTETFAAMRDALSRALVPVVQMRVERMPDLPRPWYLPEAPAQTPAQYRSALSKLGRLGMVKERVQ